MIKRIGISLLSAGVIAYMVYVAWFGVTITSYGSLGMNILALAIVIGAAGYLWLVYGLYPIYHPGQKRICFILGLFLIFFAEHILLNDANAGLYAGDISKLFGVLIIWLGATGILSNNKAIQSQKQQSKLEIIEA